MRDQWPSTVMLPIPGQTDQHVYSPINLEDITDIASADNLQELSSKDEYADNQLLLISKTHCHSDNKVIETSSYTFSSVIDWWRHVLASPTEEHLRDPLSNLNIDHVDNYIVLKGACNALFAGSIDMNPNSELHLTPLLRLLAQLNKEKPGSEASLEYEFLLLILLSKGIDKYFDQVDKKVQPLDIQKQATSILTEKLKNHSEIEKTKKLDAAKQLLLEKVFFDDETKRTALSEKIETENLWP